MDRAFARVLSGARWVAVAAVVLYHVRFLLFATYGQVHDQDLLLKSFYFATSLGHEGFVLYMVTSGMLLGGLSLQRWSHRAAAQWPVVAHKVRWFYAYLVPALLLGGLLDLAGSCLWNCTGVYAYFDLFSPDFSLKAVTENLLPVQRFIVPGLGSNAMLYLLAYECWAYLAFAAFFLSGRGRLGVLAGGAIALAGTILAPEFLGYLLLWLMGAAAFHYRARLMQGAGLATAVLVFVATLLTSRVVGARIDELPSHLLLPVRATLDLQFGVGVTLLLLVLGRASARRGRASLLLWRLNRHAPAGSSVILASHFPFMMFAVAMVSHKLAIPIAGQPTPFLFALFFGLVFAICLYGWAIAALAGSLMRMVRACALARLDWAPFRRPHAQGNRKNR